MHTQRIGLTDSVMNVVVKLAEGNPGAVTVLMRVLEKNDIPAIIAMDGFGIYGSRIWMLYKDVCKENLESALAVLRGCQLGLITESALNHAIDNYGKGLDVDAVVESVKANLGETP